MKKIKPKHITNVTYQEFDDIYYYITYPGVKPFQYGITPYGDIMSLVKHREKKLLFNFDKRGYMRVALRTDDFSTVQISIQRLVAYEFVGKPEDYKKLQVNHADGDIWNNYYKNLEWCTPQENNIHKVLYRLEPNGEKHYNARHKQKVVKDVIKCISKGLYAPEIAVYIMQKYPQYYEKTKYNYDSLRGLVSKINRGASWYILKNDMEGSTTIENIIYEKHIGEEVSRVGLHPIPVRKSGEFIYR